jgi:hypothetical protein
LHHDWNHSAYYALILRLAVEDLQDNRQIKVYLEVDYSYDCFLINVLGLVGFIAKDYE